MDTHDKSELPAPKAQTPSPLNPSWRNPWVIIAAAFLILVLLAGVAAVHRAATVIGFKGPRQMAIAPGGRMFRAYVNPNGSNLTGVVTAINGDKLTIAGNGTTSTVSTTSSTQYVGASQVAIDDTVMISGTTASGTLTATQIVINPGN